MTTPARIGKRIHYGRKGPGQSLAAKSGTGGGGIGAVEFLLASAYISNLGDAGQGITKAFGQIFLTADGVDIDKLVFKLFYRATTILLIAGSVMATSRQLFGDPISCGTNLGSGIKDDVLNSYCWMYSTFEIPAAFHGPCAKRTSDPTILFNSYYQWVPIFLLTKIGLFCLPRVFWLILEGGLMAFLTKGTTDKIVQSPKEKLDVLVDAFSKYLLHSQNRIYAFKYFMCEQLNTVILLIIWTITNKFLKGQFLDYGIAVVTHYNGLPNSEAEQIQLPNPMCEVFPRIASCNFVRYGSAGRQQTLNAICILNLNMVNDKIFLVLWFWYAILTITMVIVLLGTILQICSPALRYGIISIKVKKYLDSKSQALRIKAFIEKCYLGDWFVLWQLSKNMNTKFFTTLLLALSKEWQNRELPRINIDEVEDGFEDDECPRGGEGKTPTFIIGDPDAAYLKKRRMSKLSTISSRSEMVDLSCLNSETNGDDDYCGD